MPLINHVRGNAVPDAMLNVRTPIVRLPLWMVVFWWTLKGLVRLVVLACRYWYLTGPVLVLLWLYTRFGWWGPGLLFGGVALALTVWGSLHWASFLRFGWYPALSRWRRLSYRRRWLSAMVTARLTVSFDGHTVVPILKRVRSSRNTDRLTVRMVTGQIPDDFAGVGERLAHTFGALGARVMPGSKPDLVVIVLVRRDPLVRVVDPLPVPAVPDFTALPLGLREEGGLYLLRLFGTQVLIVGATGAGKGSVIWSLIAALAGGVRAGLVELWGFDPKGGMELGLGRPLFARFASDNFAQMADMLEQAAALAQGRADRLAGITRQHQPTQTEPVVVLVIDELANLTSYLTDRQTKDRIKSALSALLSKGRAVGVHVVAAIQDPRKDVLPFRNLFPTRIGLRLSEPGEVDMVLGDGMRDRGALCDRIPQSLPGVGFVVLDGDPTPVRVRFSFLTDEQIRELAREYGRFRVIDGQTTGEGRAA